MTVTFPKQVMAHAAYQAVSKRKGGREPDYLSFARSFPTLIHTCGLAQATAFALNRGNEKRSVLDDVAEVINALESSWGIRDGMELDGTARHEQNALKYMRLSQQALAWPGWVKRYAEAVLDSKPPAAAEAE